MTRRVAVASDCPHVAMATHSVAMIDEPLSYLHTKARLLGFEIPGHLVGGVTRVLSGYDLAMHMEIFTLSLAIDRARIDSALRPGR